MTTTYTPGDIVFCHSPTWLGKAIRWGERLHSSTKASHWNHVGIIINAQGDMIEALARGVRIGNISSYPDNAVVSPKLGIQDTKQALKFASSVVGIGYGYITVLSIFLDLLMPWFLHFKAGDTLICSELVARALEHGGWISPKLDTSHVMPSDLAGWFLDEQRP